LSLIPSHCNRTPERAAVRTAFPHPRKHLCWQAAVRSLDHGCESRSDPRSLPPHDLERKEAIPWI